MKEYLYNSDLYYNDYYVPVVFKDSDPQKEGYGFTITICKSEENHTPFDVYGQFCLYGLDGWETNNNSVPTWAGKAIQHQLFIAFKAMEKHVKETYNLEIATNGCLVVLSS